MKKNVLNELNYFNYTFFFKNYIGSSVLYKCKACC